MKTALITGSSGFVGRHMLRKLRDCHYDVRAIDIKNKHDMLTMLPDHTYDLVVHAAAAAPHRMGIDTQHNNFPYNVMLDAKIFEWAMRTRQPHIVYLSSAAVYSDHLSRDNRSFQESDIAFMQPFDVYGWTKRFGEQMAAQAQRDGVRVTVVRPFSGYGEDQSEDFPFQAFIARAKRRDDPFTIWGSDVQVRDWIHIDDICNAIMVLVHEDVVEPVNLCTGRGTAMKELAKLVCNTAGYTPQIVVDTRAPLGVHHRVGNPAMFQRYYHPKITIEEGVRRALED